jgi:hypothetical protein
MSENEVLEMMQLAADAFLEEHPAFNESEAWDAEDGGWVFATTPSHDAVVAWDGFLSRATVDVRLSTKTIFYKKS